MKLVYGLIYGLVAQVLTFLQLQGNIKYGWFQKYPIIVLISAAPISYCFIKSVEYIVAAYGGEIWPSRLIGFGVGVIVFSLMSWLMFNESFTPKTIICLILAAGIVAIQILWK
jgi:multidrug transporter EmrE-like cation transporter